MKEGTTCPIGIRPIIASHMLVLVWDLLTDGVDPIEDIEDYNGFARHWMGRGGDANATIAHLGDTAKPDRSSGEVEGEFFELLWFVVKDELVSIDGKALYSRDSNPATCS